MSTQLEENYVFQSSSLSEDEDLDEEDEQESTNISYHPITSPELSFDDLSDAVEYDRKTSNFDILALLDGDEDTFFERGIILINRVRDFVSKLLSPRDAAEIGEKLNAFLSEHLSCSEEEGGQFFKPVLEDDAYLLNLDELLLLIKNQSHDKTVAPQATEEEWLERKETSEILKMRISSLEDQLFLAKSCITRLLSTDTNTTNTTKIPVPNKKQLDSDTPYFSSYSHFSIHETMLRDHVRTDSYEKSIVNAPPNLFSNKIILDVGCGTGILSLFAARAGAKRVYALDGSAEIAHAATKIVAENGYEKIIHVHHTKVEDWKLPPGEEKVDLIISEWMGYALLFESMLPSVLYARDNFMRDGGTVYPNSAQIYIEGASDDRFLFWNDVHGMSMKPMRRKVEEELTTEASVEIVPASDIVTNRFQLISLNMDTVKDKDLDFEANFSLKKHALGGGKVDKLVLSFDVEFVESKTSFSTGCQSQPTHWKQTTLWLDSIVAPTLNKDELFLGTLKMTRNEKNERAIDFDVKWWVQQDGTEHIRCDGSIKSVLAVY